VFDKESKRDEISITKFKLFFNFLGKDIILVCRQSYNISITRTMAI
jgi:hypothetical protein